MYWCCFNFALFFFLFWVCCFVAVFSLALLQLFFRAVSLLINDSFPFKLGSAQVYSSTSFLSNPGTQFLSFPFPSLHFCSNLGKKSWIKKKWFLSVRWGWKRNDFLFRWKPFLVKSIVYCKKKDNMIFRPMQVRPIKLAKSSLPNVQVRPI